MNKSMKIHLKELESIAEDIEDLASDERCIRAQQELLGKAARIYDVVYEIQDELRHVLCEVNDG